MSSVWWRHAVAVATCGANAFAAVINIITKTAAQVPGEFVSLQLGEQDMRGLRFATVVEMDLCATA